MDSIFKKIVIECKHICGIITNQSFPVKPIAAEEE